MSLPLKGPEHIHYALSICGMGVGGLLLKQPEKMRKKIQIRTSTISEVMQYRHFRTQDLRHSSYLNRANDGLHINLVITVRIVIPEYLLCCRLPAQ